MSVVMSTDESIGGKTRPLCQDILAQLAKRAPRPIRMIVPIPAAFSVCCVCTGRITIVVELFTISLQIVAKEACSKGLVPQRTCLQVLSTSCVRLWTWFCFVAAMETALC